AFAKLNRIRSLLRWLKLRLPVLLAIRDTWEGPMLRVISGSVPRCRLVCVRSSRPTRRSTRLGVTKIRRQGNWAFGWTCLRKVLLIGDLDRTSLNIYKKKKRIIK